MKDALTDFLLRVGRSRYWAGFNAGLLVGIFAGIEPTSRTIACWVLVASMLIKMAGDGKRRRLRREAAVRLDTVRRIREAERPR